MTETEVLCVDLPNQAGALADVATVLGQNHININYAYCTSGAPGGRTTGVFKTGDHAKRCSTFWKRAQMPIASRTLHRTGGTEIRLQ